MKTLFRREAVPVGESQKQSMSLDIGRTAFTYCAIVILLVLIAIALYFVFGSYSPKQTVAGYLVSDSGLVRLYAPFSGTITKRYVSPGNIVAVGDPLYRLEAQQSTLKTGDINDALVTTLEQRKHLLLTQKKRDMQAAAIEFSGLQTNIPVIINQIAALEAELFKRHEAFSLQEKGLDRLKNMLADGAVSQAGFEAEKAKLLEQRATLLSQESNLIRLKAEKTELQNQIDIFPVHTAQQQAEYDEQLAVLEQEILRVSATSNAIIKAPIAGVVSGLVYEQGQYVTPQLPLLSILPQGSELQARLLVPSRAIGLIEPGQTVNLRYRAFPYQQYGAYRGIVRRVSRSATSSQDANLPFAVQEPVYLVTVDLTEQVVHAYGKELPLQTGMLLEADIVTGHMRLYEWFLQPLYRLRGSL